MSRPCKELKRIARENLTGHYGIPMGALLTASAVTLAALLPFSMLQKEKQSLFQTVIFYVAYFLIVLIAAVLSAGLMKLHLAMARKKPYEISMVFYGFKNRPDRYILTALLLMLAVLAALLPVTAGAVLLLVFPVTAGIIAVFVLLAFISLALVVLLALQYALCFFLVLEHEDIKPADALRKSRALTKGHRGQLFYIFLSFLGLHFLSLISFGIGSLWVAPYQSQTFAGFYLDVIGEIPKNVSSKTDSSAYPTFNQYV